MIKGQTFKAKAKDGLIPLHLAADAKTASLLLEKSIIDTKSKKGHTPLHFASLLGKADIVAMLIARGASVHAKDLSGMTPLGFALI